LCYLYIIKQNFHKYIFPITVSVFGYCNLKQFDDLTVMTDSDPRFYDRSTPLVDVSSKRLMSKGGFRGRGAMLPPPRSQTLCNIPVTLKNTMLVCTAIKMPPIAANYAFHFHMVLNFRLCTSKNAPASWGLRAQDPCRYRGFSPAPHLLNR